MTAKNRAASGVFAAKMPLRADMKHRKPSDKYKKKTVSDHVR